MRHCTKYDFDRINATDIWRKRFGDGPNDGSLLCDNMTNVNGKPFKFKGSYLSDGSRAATLANLAIVNCV